MVMDSEALRALWQRPAQVPAEYASAFPLSLYERFLQRLSEAGVVVLTYRDLFAESDDWDHASFYQREFQDWHRHRRNPAKRYVLIQHDVDFVPAFTKRMVAMERAYGVRSNVFLFTELAKARAADSPYDDSPYDVDHDFFVEAERAGFVIGYHQNALSLTTGGMEEATARFATDVETLRRRYDVRFFCPHGGQGRIVDGVMMHNVDVPMPDRFVGDGGLRWVYNRYGPKFSARYSDGGLRNVADPERLKRLDLAVDFLERLKPGERGFVLVHPQLWGWNVNPEYCSALNTQPWYRQALRENAAGSTSESI